MTKNFPGGSWPVMLTPFTEKNEVDYRALEQLVNWYIKNGVSGLFAVCQSSEMFFLSLEERVKIAKEVVKYSGGRVPVIASGHVSEDIDMQIKELNEMAETGIDAVVFITNRLAKEDDLDEVWIENCKKLMNGIKKDIPLGFYECPYPYKRLLSVDTIKWCANTGRFFFLKDTCCDISIIKEKLSAIEGSNLKLYNANTTTLLESIKLGATGFSGVMDNFHPKLYTWLCDNVDHYRAEEISDFLTIASMIERQYYPVNAKYHIYKFEDVDMSTNSRTKNDKEMTETFKREVEILNRMAKEKETLLGL